MFLYYAANYRQHSQEHMFRAQTSEVRFTAGAVLAIVNDLHRQPSLAGVGTVGERVVTVYNELLKRELGSDRARWLPKKADAGS